MLKIKVFENAQSFYVKEYPADTDIKVGRAEHCDLVLRSKRVSREHCHIFFENGSWQAQDLKSQNGIRVNGVKTHSEAIKNGDSLQVGDYRLEIILTDDLSASQAAPEGDDHTVLLDNSDASDLTVVRSPDFFDAGSETVSDKKNIGSLLKSKRLLAGVIGLFCVLLIFIIISSSSNNTEDPEKTLLPAEQEKTEAMIDMESQHRMRVYLESGKEQYDAGNLNEALVRFQAVLNIDPENEIARTYLGQCREKIMALEKQKQLAAEEEKRRMERVSMITSRARNAFSQSDYSGAMEIIAEAAFLAPKDDAVFALKAEIANALEKEKKRKEETLHQNEADRAKIKRHFENGQQYYDQGKYHEALQEWEAVLATGLDTPETAHVEHAIPHVKALLEDDVRKDYEKGKSYFKDKDFTKAVRYLEKVSQILPDYQDTEKMLAQSVNELESEARQLFQEGLVYEGIGQNDKAAAKWREVLKIMPVESNEYYQKALEKLH